MLDCSHRGSYSRETKVSGEVVDKGSTSGVVGIDRVDRSTGFVLHIVDSQGAVHLILATTQETYDSNITKVTTGNGSGHVAIPVNKGVGENRVSVSWEATEHFRRKVRSGKC